MDAKFGVLRRNADELGKKADVAKNEEMLKKIDYLGKLNDLKMARKDASRAM